MFYTEEDFPKADYLHYSSWVENVRFHPRNIYMDARENAIYSVYANTDYEYMKAVPAVLRIDLDTKETKYFTSYFTRDISADTSSIMATPWFVKKVYELDKKDLSVIRTFPIINDLYPWKVRDIYHDSLRNCVYITYDMDSVLQKYDYKTGELIGTMDSEIFDKYGTLELWLMQVSKKTGMIYLVPQGVMDIDIIEINPDTLEIQRTLDLKLIEPGALQLDDENQLLYCQDLGTNRLYEIDIKDFKVKRLLKGSVHSRKIHIDKKRNCLYLLNYPYGKLIAIDLSSGKRLWTLKVGGKPYGLAAHNDAIYINSRAGIVKVDLETVWKERFD